MDFYDTLKDKNMKAIFPIVAMSMYPGKWSELREELDEYERLEIFRVCHSLLHALGLPNGEQPQYLRI